MNKPITVFLREIRNGQVLPIDFPTSKNEFSKLLYSVVKIFYAEKISFDRMPRAEKILMHSPIFNEINFLAILYGQLSDEDKQLYKDVVESECAGITGMKELINLTQSLDSINMVEGVETPSMLCQRYISMVKQYDPKPFLEKIQPKDYRQIGNLLVRRARGRFYKGNYYAMRTGHSLADFYSGDENAIPNDAKIFI